MTAAERRTRIPGWGEYLAVFALYALIACVATWPLVRVIDHAVLGPPGDNLEYVWKMAWFKRAILDEGISPFFHPNVFYPVGYPVALSETTVAHTVLGLPLTALWGEVVAYNLMMLLSFVLSGYGVYLWVRSLSASRSAAFCAGVAFAFAPYRMSHLGAGHLPLMGTGYIALLFWAMERFAQERILGRGALMGMFYALTALSSWYYAAMVAPIAAIYLVWRLRPWRLSLKGAGTWRGLVVGYAVACLLMAPAAMPLLKLYDSGQASYEGSLAYIDQWSASPLDMIYPNAMHPVWGAALTDAYYQNINENLIYLGWVALALALIGTMRSAQHGPKRLLGTLALVTAVLACGTTLHFGGERVYVSVSPVLEDTFSRAMYALTGKCALNPVSYGSMQRPAAVPIPLPTLALYLWVPFVNAMRVWSRFAALTMLFVAALAGLGVDALASRVAILRLESPWRKVGAYWLAPLMALLILLDFAALPYAYGYTLTEPQPLDRWLAQQEHPSPVIAYPLDKTWYGWMLYPEEQHRQPIAYGYGTFVPKEYAASEDTLRSWPSQEALELLRNWGVRYVVMGAESYGEAWAENEAAIDALDGVDQVARFHDEPRFVGDRLLSRVAPTADVPSTELINGPQQVHLHDDLVVYELR